MKKFISVILCLCIVFAFSACTSKKNKVETTNAVTVEETTTPLHETEVPDGYIGVYKIDDFEYIRTNPNYNYILMNDVDFSNVSDWKNIDINGDFDGNNYSIVNYKNNLSFFKTVKGTIWDLLIKNADVSANAVLCNRLIGVIDNCTVSGNINYSLDSFMLKNIDTNWNLKTIKL